MDVKKKKKPHIGVQQNQHKVQRLCNLLVSLSELVSTPLLLFLPSLTIRSKPIEIIGEHGILSLPFPLLL